ncbi:Spx/MgsR family RNA polymerase-binding regulatory protein [Salinicoccus albus]|uniref:Spx/MgsR family RNA polymerase-binding regulatory protein n=1 Tax=Salinicoccus albus TaxID=418756 RepID=UPI00037D83D5|nr:Spx/MgsR family RNA polymerase-binding regulatory protein [Salinicoccus albus]
MITFYEYSRCTTCRKARKFLDDNGAEFERHDMVRQPPEPSVLRKIISQSDQPVDDFFNKRGKKFRDLDLKNRLETMDDEEKIELLSSDGLLIKRPLAWDGENVILGFEESDYEEAFLD